MKWYDLAKEKMKSLGITQEVLAERLGVTKGAVSHWLNGRREPSLDLISLIMKELNLPEITFQADNATEQLKGDNFSFHGYHKASKEFPLISWVSAGQWSEALEPYKLDEIEEWPETTVHCSPGSFWLTVKGDSMTSPVGFTVPEGMIILVDPEEEAKSGKLVVAKLINENEATFKKYVEDAGRKFLKALNPQYPITEINGNCKIIGVVVDVKWRRIP